LSEKGRSRILYVDNLRIVLIALIIMLHISITYGGEGDWYYNEPSEDIISAIVLTLFNAIIQSFVLGFFFMISGYFTPGSYSRKGSRTYLKDRLMRLGIPLLIYFFIISPLLVYTLYVFLMDQYRPLQTFFGTGPLWFIEVLLIFCLGFYLWKRHNPKSTVKLRRPPQSRDIMAFILLLSLASFLVRIWWPIGKSFSNLQFAFFPGYISLFVVGIVAFENGWFKDFSDRVGMKWLVFSVPAIFLFPVVGLLGGAVEDLSPFMGGFHWQSFFYCMWEASVGCGLIAGIFVIFRRFFNSQTPFTRILSDNAYSVFVIHAPVIVFLSYALRGFHVHPLLKFAFVSFFGVSLCFLLSHLVVRRIPFSKKIL
jgi:glucan biosynthesis protein C